ncbi:MAG: helix-turn-helix domain-containing protein [Candidatus Hodarchaeota archaeon]
MGSIAYEDNDPPKYDNTLGYFAQQLRLAAGFDTLEKAGEYFGLSHSTVSRYENEDDNTNPPLGYLAKLAILIVDKQKDPQSIERYQNALLEQLNNVVRRNYDHKRYRRESTFSRWDELRQSANDYGKVTKSDFLNDNADTSQLTTTAKTPQISYVRRMRLVITPSVIILAIVVICTIVYVFGILSYFEPPISTPNLTITPTHINDRISRYQIQ